MHNGHQGSTRGKLEMPDSGLLVVDKPPGMTSHDVVDRVRRALGVKRVGHAGTLDPAATGVLLVGVGNATRLLQFLQRLAKTYRAGVKFGVTTTTQDHEGEVIDIRPCSFTLSDLEEIAGRFVGEIEQVPPMVSAVKVGGEPLYRIARRGEEVERKPRIVRLYEISIEEFNPDGWTATLRVDCSSGTYIRTLAADMGEQLGCGAHIIELRRLGIGSFGEKEAVPLDDIRDSLVLSPAEAMRDFPSIVVDEEMAGDVAHGRPLPNLAATRSKELQVLAKPREGDVAPHEAGMVAGVPVGVLDSDGRLLAVYRRTREGMRPEVVLVAR